MLGKISPFQLLLLLLFSFMIAIPIILVIVFTRKNSPPSGTGYTSYHNSPQNNEYSQQLYANVYGQKSRLTAGLLQLFFGGLGIGRFYLGYTGIGIAQILVTIFTCGIGGIWGFIDGILILIGAVAKTDAKGMPLEGGSQTTASNAYHGEVQSYHNQKSRTKAGLLQFIFGLGIGRFYLGNKGLGFAQLLLTIFTCGVGGIWGIVDGARILTGFVATDAKGVPLRGGSSMASTKGSYFDGGPFQLLFWTILGRLLTFFTFGLGYPWAMCMVYGWTVKHTVVNDRRLKFNGTGLSLFGHWILWWFLCVITAGIYYIWLNVALEKWRVSHTTFADGTPYTPPNPHTASSTVPPTHGSPYAQSAFNQPHTESSQHRCTTVPPVSNEQHAPPRPQAESYQRGYTTVPPISNEQPIPPRQAEPYYANRNYGRQFYPEQPRHSLAGIISFLIAVFAFIYGVIAITITGPRGIIGGGAFFFCFVIGVIILHVGFILAIVGLCQRNAKKVFCVLGLISNLLITPALLIGYLLLYVQYVYA